MATLSSGNLTLADLAKRQDPNGNIATIVEALTQTNEILADISFKEGNLTTGHRTVIRTGLPTATLRMLNEYVASTKSNTAQVTFDTAEAVSWAQIDQELVRMAANPDEFIASEVKAHMNGMMNTVATNLFYGNHTLNPRQPNGISFYYNSKSAQSADNIVDAGGTGSSNASIWLVGWGDTAISGITPKGMAAGLQVTPFGEAVSENSNGLMKVNRTEIKQAFGLAVEDWRYAARACNITRASLSSIDLPDLMFSLIERLPETASVRPVFYMDRTVLEALRKQLATRTAQSTLTYENVGGIRTAMYQGVPIRRVQALKTDEARVV